MAEPTTTAVAAVITAISAVTLALFGVDYYALLYALVGALLGLLSIKDPMSRVRAVFYVLLNTVVGAALGSALADAMGAKTQVLLSGICVVSGAGAQLLVARAIAALGARIDSFGGSK